jgi:mono/diheme cytochrome c family protein
MIRALRLLLWLALLAAAGGWFLTRPERLDAAALEGATGDPQQGAPVFAAAGCANCHIAPDATITDSAPVLSGGRSFATPFGTFRAPNISPDPEYGIGSWSDAEIVQAIMKGVRPDGAHLYPVFPYAAYARAEPSDILSLVAYLRTLPPSSRPSQPHDMVFPFSVRRGLGLWKLMFLRDGWAVAGDLDPAAQRGRYLAEALAHCSECHTPRNALGGPERSRWLAGAPNPVGKGEIPNITPAELDWSAADIAYYLESGFTPDFDTAGGHMALVVQSLAQLPGDDRAAIAAYLKAVPPAE